MYMDLVDLQTWLKLNGFDPNDEIIIGDSWDQATGRAVKALIDDRTVRIKRIQVLGDQKPRCLAS
jgi:hypothetical protein